MVIGCLWGHKCLKIRRLSCSRAPLDRVCTGGGGSATIGGIFYDLFGSMVSIKQHRGEFQAAVDFLINDLVTVRTGRANAALVDRILVENYGAMTPIQHVASISVPDARTILISPWDKGALKEIEKAIVAANLGINPVNDGVAVRLSMPMMTEEVRKAQVKMVGQKVEQAKISLRGLRDKIKDEVISQEKAKEITEDDRYSLLEELDAVTKEYSGEVEQIGKAKETEIMEI